MATNKKAGRLAVSVLTAAVTIASAAIPAEKAMADTDKSKKSAPADVQKVVLPANTDKVFDFILDPQQLINETDGAAYDGQTFEKDTTLFFKRAEEKAEKDYTSTSDAVKLVNKGETEVEVVLTAEVSSLGGITMTDDRKFSGDKGTSLYLALTDGEKTVPIDAGQGAEIRATIPAAGEGDNTYSFRLTGVANGKGDWTDLTDAKPEVAVTWKIIPGEPVSEISDESIPETVNTDDIWTAVSPTEPEP